MLCRDLARFHELIAKRRQLDSLGEYKSLFSGFGWHKQAQPGELWSILVFSSDHRDAAHSLVLFGEAGDDQGGLKCHNLDFRIILKEG